MFRLNFIQKKGKKNIFTLLEKKEEDRNKEKHDRVYPAKSTDTSISHGGDKQDFVERAINPRGGITTTEGRTNA